MKLKVYDIAMLDLQEWCDKYQEKIIHLSAYKVMESGSAQGDRILVVIDVE
jgi:hypothetical protein